jgi:hypothetical protein
MTIDQTLCAALSQANASYDDYVRQVVQVAVGPLVAPSPGSEATAVMRFEIIHTDAVCQTPLADACVHVVSRDDDIRFVAPEAGAADNYVSYWHRESDPTNEHSGWAVLAAAQKSRTHEVLLLGQTLPHEIAKVPDTGSGGGYLHHEIDRPTDGWTVSVGVHHPGGLGSLTGQPFSVAVLARPYWTSASTSQTVTLA